VTYRKGSTDYYSIADANWNVAALTNTAGAVQERYTYSAFGKVNIFDAAFATRATSSCSVTRTFTGQVLDSETGLMLYRNRVYHPTLGRFVQRDPIGYAAEDENLYRYVGNRANTMIDAVGETMGRGEQGFHLAPKPAPPSPRPKPGFKLCQLVTPNQNGCGAKNGYKLKTQDTGLWNFTPACNAHDLCYGTCGSDKADCDRKFRDDMYEACEAYNRWLLPLLPPGVPIYRACRAQAYTYYNFVKIFGQGAFDEAQKEGVNCKEIPEDECCPVPEGKPESPPSHRPIKSVTISPGPYFHVHF